MSEQESPEEWAKKMTTNTLVERLLAFNHETLPRSLAREAARRLEDVDNCICWGVDCVHQAKALDMNYSHYVAAEKAKKVLGNPNNYNHAPYLRAALKELVDAIQERHEAKDPQEAHQP